MPPGTFADLGSPGSPKAISDAEERLGLKLPREMWQWLLANDIGGRKRPDAGSCLVALGCEGVIPSGGLLLGLTDIQRVYLHMWGLEKMEPSADPEWPSWRREWVPIASESDGFYGRFLDTRTGTVGSWSEGSLPEEGRFATLADFFHDAADHLEGCPRAIRGKPPGVLRGTAVRRARRYDSGPARTATSSMTGVASLPPSVRRTKHHSECPTAAKHPTKATARKLLVALVGLLTQAVWLCPWLRGSSTDLGEPSRRVTVPFD